MRNQLLVSSLFALTVLACNGNESDSESATGGTGGAPSSDSGGTNNGGSGTAGNASTCSPETAIRTSAGSQALCEARGQGNPDAWWPFGRYQVYDNMWNCNQGYTLGPETIYVCSESSWFVESGQWSQSGACMTYPATQVDFNSGDGIPIGNYTAISSTFSVATPHVGIYEATYDIWINGIANPPTSTEIMIWVDNFHQTPAGNVVDTTTLGGRTYEVWATGDRSYIAFVPTTPFPSGTVDLLGVFQYVMNRGWIATSSTLNQIGFGFEIVSTQSPDPAVNGGGTATFHVNDYSVTCSPPCT